jgi:hypothetical protein
MKKNCLPQLNNLLLFSLNRNVEVTNQSLKPTIWRRLLLLGFLFFTLAFSAQAQTTVTFNLTGSEQQWVVPAGVTSLQVTAKGAKGGDGNDCCNNPNSPGGQGGTVSATLAVTPGTTLYIYVGEQGKAGQFASGFAGATRAFNGGGLIAGYYFDGTGNGGGGGATDIRIGGNALSNRVLVAGGGGGGAASYDQSAGGAGGDLIGGAGQGGEIAGQGGTQSAGGTGNDGGSLGIGGDAAPNGATGGGGGYYGGGAGEKTDFASGGGGGGSSYSDPTLCTSVMHTQGDNNGDGELMITYCAFTPSNIAVSGYGLFGINGTYTPNGTVNGAPSWLLSPYGVTIKWSSTNNRWELFSNFFGSLVSTNSTGSITNLPCSTGWVDVAGGGTVVLSGGCGSLLPPTVTPSVSIAAAPGNSITAGTSVTFTATPTNGGTTPMYEWNGEAPTTSNTYTSTTLADGDVVNCLMTSNDPCASPTTATSNTITMTVTNPCTTPTAYFLAGGGTYCGGIGLTVELLGSDVGVTYQLRYEGIAISGATAAGTGSAINFSAFPQVDAGTYTVIANTDGCPITDTEMTGATVITLGTAPAEFAVTGGGPACPAPVGISGSEVDIEYQIFLDGVITNTIFIGDGNPQGDLFTALGTYTMIALAPNGCITPLTGNAVVTAAISVTPSVSITADPGNSINVGTEVTFTATPTNGGDTPTYQWMVNGNPVGTDQDTYTSTTLEDGDEVTCEMTSSDPCAAPATATSNAIVMAVCPITAIAVSNLSDCDAQNTTCTTDDTFTADVTVTFASKPASGTLELTGPNIVGTVTAVNVDNIGATSHTFTGVTMAADGGDIALTATFSEGCDRAANLGTSPRCFFEPHVPTDIVLTSTGCSFADGTYVPTGTQNGAPRWVNPVNNIYIEWSGSAWVFGIFATNTSGSITELPCSTGWEGFCGEITLSGGCGNLAGTTTTPDCDIANISLANTSGCTNPGNTNTPTDDYFTTDVTVTFAYAPAGGTLTLKRGTTVVATTSADLTCTTTHTFTGVQMATDGSSIVLTAEFTSGCTFTSGSLGTAPNACSCVPAVATNNGPVCEGGTIIMSVNPNLPVGVTATYFWSGPAGTASTQNPSIKTMTPAKTGLYTVTVTYSNGCTATATTVLATNPKPVISSVVASCVAGSGRITVTATGTGLTYNRGTGAQTNNVFNGLANGTYTVTITNDSGCTATSSVTVNCTACPTPVANNNSPICTGGNINLTVNPALPAGVTASYMWSGPSGTATLQNPTIANATPTKAGVYTVTVTYSNGCTATASTTVTLAPSIAGAILGPSSFCIGGSAVLTATGGGTYVWSTSATSASITVTTAGTYVVTITNGTGCKRVSKTVTTTTCKNTVATMPETLLVTPNPFSTHATIEFMTNSNGHTSINVYSIDGKQLATLYNANTQAGEIYQVTLDGANLPRGMYFVEMTNANGKKMLVKAMLSR